MALKQDGFLIMHHTSDFHSYTVGSAQILPPSFNSCRSDSDIASNIRFLQYGATRSCFLSRVAGVIVP
jgi:hypothetical protein